NALMTGIQGPLTMTLGPRKGVPATRSSRGAPRGDERPVRLRRPHFVSAPDEAATETAADPEQRQEDVTQDKGRRRSKAKMPAGRARERGFGAIPHGRDCNDAAQRQPQRRNDIRGRGERGETAGQKLQRIILPERGLPELRPAQLTRPHFAGGAIAERLLERRVDQANVQPKVAHEFGRGRILGGLGREQSNAAGPLDLAAPIEHRLALGTARAGCRWQSASRLRMAYIGIAVDRY